MKKELRDYSLKNKENEEMNSDPRIMLESISNSLSDNGGLKNGEECEIILNAMKNTSKLVPKFICVYVLQATPPEVLESFVKIGGWSQLNKHLCMAKDESNAPLLIELMKVISKVPLKIAHLKENNTAKVVKSLSKSSNPAIKSSATSLMDKFMNVIHGNNAEAPTKKIKKDKLKSKHKEPKNEQTKSAPVMKQKTKFRKTGLEEEADQPPKKKSKPPGRVPIIANKEKPKLGRIPLVKDAEKKATINHVKPEKQKKITMSGGFMDALIVPAAIPQKRVKRKISRNTTTPSSSTPSNHNNNTAEIHRTESEPTLPVPIEEPASPPKPKLNRFGKPMKSVSWCSDDRLTAVRYFEVHENERVNVSTQNFKDKMLREHMFERQHLKGNFSDGDQSDLSWRRPPKLDLPDGLVVRGCNSIEKDVQREREKTVLQIFLSKDSVPDTPTEPDPEPYEVVQPTIIPLVDENGGDEDDSQNDSVSKNILSTVVDNSQSANSNVGDLKEKLKEILNTASAITPVSNGNGEYPQQQPEFAQPPMPHYNNQYPPPPMGMMPQMQQGYYQPPIMMQGGHPMSQGPPMQQNYAMQHWQQQPNYQMGPQHQQYQQYNNNNHRPRWHGHRGRPRHAR